MPARKRRAIQRAVEDEVDEQRDVPGNDEQRDLEKLYNVWEEREIYRLTVRRKIASSGS